MNVRINYPHYLPKMNDLGLLKRLLPKIQQVDGGCWTWQGCRDRNGYGKAWWNRKSHWVHRLAYALFNGPIEAGLTIDHKCSNHACCNPEHLEAVTQSENSIRRWENACT